MIPQRRKFLSPCLKFSALALSLVSGYYHRAFAGSCASLGAGTYSCSGAAAPGDTTQTLTGPSLTVTTSPGFSINASGGDAFDLTSSHGLVFTDDHMSIISGFEDGIVAVNDSSSDLSIRTNGTVIGGYNNNSGVGIGIWANNQAPDGSLSISAATVTGNDDGINATNSGSGHLVITTSGAVHGENDTGVLAENHGTYLTITTAEVAGGMHGIVAASLGSGDLSITTTGTATGGTSGIGIWANNSGRDLTLSTAGVSGGDKGILATNHGSGHLSITSSGKVTSTGNGMLAFGISATNYGDGNLSITARDTVSSTGIGAYAIGIYANNSANGTDLAISTADVRGGYAGIYANNSGSGNLSITSSGTVEATRGSGIMAHNLHGTALTISTTDVSGETAGIRAINEGSGALTITAGGTVTGTYDFGILAYNFGTGLTISAANVSGGNIGIGALNFGSGALAITSSGAVMANGFGVEAINTNTGTDLTISAANVSGGFEGILATNSGSGALTITASGTVTGGMGGIYANNFGTDLTISAANVSGGRDGIDAINLGSGALSITAGGTVTGTAGKGIYALNNGGPTTINVTPTGVVAGGLAGIAANSLSGQPVLIDVFGQVRNLSGQTTDNAITVSGGPAAVNFHSGSVTTGLVATDDFADTVTLAGTLNGSVRLNDGNDTFSQSGGSVLTGTADGGSGVDTLNLYNMGLVNGIHYLNFENLAILGGSTTIAGLWDFSGGTATVYQGSFYVNGELLTSHLTVERDGLLGGSGHIFGDVTVFGTVSPGNSIGTLDVTGAVDFMPGSTYVAQLAADGDSDLLRVDGPVSIDGGRLKVSLARGLYANGESWRVIEASGGIRGSFSSVATDFSSATINLTPAYRGDALDLVIDRTPYETFGGTANEAAVGAALDALLPSAGGTMASLLTGMDFDLDAAGISATLAGLNPEMYTAFLAADLTVSRNFSEIVTLRQQESRTTPAILPESPENLWNVWGRAFGDWLDRDTDNSVTGYTLDTGGMVFGLDRDFFSRLRAGIELGYSNSDLTTNTRGNDGQIDAKHIGVYAGTRLGGFYLDGSAGYTGIDDNANRLLATPFFTARTAGSFSANVWNGTLTGGYDFTFGPVRLGPVASVDYRHLDQDDITENGAGDFALRLESDTEDSLSSALGLRATANLHKAGWRFLPRAGIALGHQFKNDPVQLTANYAGYREADFTVTGTEPPDNQVQVNLGITIECSRSLAMYLDLAADMASGQGDTLLTGGLAWNF